MIIIAGEKLSSWIPWYDTLEVRYCHWYNLSDDMKQYSEICLDPSRVADIYRLGRVVNTFFLKRIITSKCNLLGRSVGHLVFDINNIVQWYEKAFHLTKKRDFAEISFCFEENKVKSLNKTHYALYWNHRGDRICPLMMSQ